jgi:hypothetical protein
VVLSRVSQVRLILLSGAYLLCLNGPSLHAQGSGTAITGKFGISGAVQDCFGGVPIPSARTKIRVFDVTESRPLLRRLAKMEELLSHADSTHGTDRLTRFFAEYDSLLPLVERTRPLARAVTDSAGAFRTAFARVDSVLLFAYDEREDSPTYYQYKIMRGRPDTSVVIDMAKGECTRIVPRRYPAKLN